MVVVCCRFRRSFLSLSLFVFVRLYLFGFDLHTLPFAAAATAAVAVGSYHICALLDTYYLCACIFNLFRVVQYHIMTLVALSVSMESTSE